MTANTITTATHYNIFTGRTVQTLKKSKESKKSKKKNKQSTTKKSKKKKSKKEKSPITSECQFNPPSITIINYRNGKCDSFLNTPECDYDGGDCLEFNTNYPSCTVSKPYYIGDNFCDGPEYNTTECGFDGGDCIEDIDYGCSGAANGYCQNIFNTEKCNYDGGDCEEFNELYPDCKVPDPSYVGDGLCDNKEPYYTEECGWDGGDCDDFPVDCKVKDTYVIGDGVCNVEWNTTECEYDGGDCLCESYYYYGHEYYDGGCFKD